MIDRIKNISKKKLIIVSILIVLILLVVILLVTRAFINPAVSDEALTNVNVSSCGYYTLNEKSTPIDLTNSFPMTDNRGMNTDPYIFTLNNTCETNKGFNLYLVITSETTIPSDEIKLSLSTINEIKAVDSLPKVTLSNETISEYTQSVGKEIKEVYLLQSATLVPDLPVTLDLRMWINETAGNELQNKNFSATIMVADGVTSSDNILYPEISDICQGEDIASCYAEYSFLDETLLYHNEKLENGAQDNNYRYSGASDIVNNYVNFNNELWRIIGVYDEEGEKSLKLIKDTAIDKDEDGTLEITTNGQDTLQWDAGNSNDYETSDIKEYLNNEYYNSLDDKYKNMIKSSTWNVGGNNTYGETPYEFYRDNIESPVVEKKSTGKVGLMYVSDYGYGAQADAWVTDLSGYTNQTIRGNNWLFNLSGSQYEWTILPISQIVTNAFYVRYDGLASNGATNNGYGVRPVVYLESGILLDSGSGTQSDPLEIKHSKTFASECTNKNMAECFVNNSYLDETLLLHDENLENGAGDNNYRYSGGNDIVNNHVCFGSNESPCPEDNKYRILGIYDGSVKLIKATTVDKNEDGTVINGVGTPDSIVWDAESINNYETSDIKDYLNIDFYNTIPSSYQSMIKISDWHVGGSIPTLGTAYEFYTNNIGNPSLNTIYNAKIGLMYPSDFGYSAQESAWTTALWSYSAQSIKDNNWLCYLETSQYEWTIMPNRAENGHVYFIDQAGIVFTGLANSLIGARPSFYLEPIVILAKGIGTSDDPFYLR